MAAKIETTKPEPKPEPKSEHERRVESEPKSEDKPAEELAERVSRFSVQATGFVEDVRAQLTALTDEADSIVRECSPGPNDAALVPAMRRVTGWDGDVRRILEGVAAAASDLARVALR